MSFKDTCTVEVPTTILEDPGFTIWIENTDGSLLLRVEVAIEKISSEGVVTGAKDLGSGLYEKKWRSGLRLYFAVIESDGLKTLLLRGSGKEDQQQVINKARDSLKRYQVCKKSMTKKN